MLVATCAECQLEAPLDAAAVVEGDLRCEACHGALVLVMADEGGDHAPETYGDERGYDDDDGYESDVGYDDDTGYEVDDAGYEVEVGAFGGDLSVNFEGVFADEAPGFSPAPGPGKEDVDLYTDELSAEEQDLDHVERHDDLGADEDLGEHHDDLGDDPFAQAAAQLDSSVSATIQRARRSASVLLGEALPPLLEDDGDFQDDEDDEDDEEGPNLDDTVEAARTEILQGEPPVEEPLPSFDGGDTYWIESLAEEPPQFSMAPPLSLEGTNRLAPVGKDETGVLSMPLKHAEPEPADVHAGEVDDPLEGTQRTPLFGDDAVDWLALLDDNLTESEQDDPTAERVYIQLPESAAPNAALEEEQFKEAVKQLEEGGPEAFAEVYSKTGRIDLSAATQAISQAKADSIMAQIDTRNWSQEETAPGSPPVPSGDSTVPLDVYDTSRIKADSTQPLAGMDTSKFQADSTLPLAAMDTSKLQADSTLPLAAMGTGHVQGRSEPPPAPEQGTLEWDRSGADPSLVTLLDGNSQSADYFRQLYQRVFHSERGDGPRVVLVTSARPGEGKTTVATNLALVAARSPHRRAFLVDADPRGGGVLRYLGIRRRVDGLLEALDADEDPAKRLLPLDVPGDLRVLPLGIPGSDAIDLLASDRRVGDLLSRLRSVDPQAMIVIDSSYALDVADPLVWARLVDGVIVVTRAGKTAKADVRQTLELIGFEKVLGVVLNDARIRKR